MAEVVVINVSVSRAVEGRRKVRRERASGIATRDIRRSVAATFIFICIYFFGVVGPCFSSLRRFCDGDVSSLVLGSGFSFSWSSVG